MSVRAIRGLAANCDAPGCSASTLIGYGSAGQISSQLATQGWYRAVHALSGKFEGMSVYSDFCPTHAPNGDEILRAEVTEKFETEDA